MWWLFSRREVRFLVHSRELYKTLKEYLFVLECYFPRSAAKDLTNKISRQLCSNSQTTSPNLGLVTKHVSSVTSIRIREFVRVCPHLKETCHGTTTREPHQKCSDSMKPAWFSPFLFCFSLSFSLFCPFLFFEQSGARSAQMLTASCQRYPNMLGYRFLASKVVVCTEMLQQDGGHMPGQYD